MVVCREVSELVTDYLERSMTIRRRLELRWHLARCEACRRYFDQMRRTIRLLRSGRPGPLPEDAETRLVAMMRRTGID